MTVPFFCLILASLLLAPALGRDPPSLKRFKDNHTYNNRNRNFDCTYEMNRKQSHLTYCRPRSSVILGDGTDVTPIDDVINICRGQGTFVGDNLYRSNTNFRTVTCRLQNRNAAPPRCVYTGTLQEGRITVGCSHGNPEHFEGCE